jgi:hypothetical protein
MSKDLTPIPQYVAIHVPEGGDPRTAASVEVGFQGCADSLEFLKNHVPGAALDPIAADLTFMANAGSRFDYAETFIVQTSVADAGQLILEVKIPKGAVKIQSYIMEIHGHQGGGSAHSAMPATKPKITLLRQPIAGGPAVIVGAGPITDLTSSHTVYDTRHDVGEAGVNHTIVANSRYFLSIEGETGANSQANSLGIMNAFIGVSPS